MTVRAGRQACVCLAFLAAAVTVNLHAAELDTPPANPSQGNEATQSAGTLSEVVVTAQKRAENVMSVPISIVALTGDSLRSKGVLSMDDLQAAVPAAEFSHSNTQMLPYIRGVGTAESAVGSESSVAMYIDGVYQTLGAANNINLNDLDRIEVLKGPQGTLFGRNATGGAISILTKDPSFDPSLTLMAGYGNYQTVESDVYGTTRVADGLATNLAFHYSDQGQGFGRDVNNGLDVSKIRGYSVRNKWLWSGWDDLRAVLSLSYSETAGAIGVALNLYPGALGLGGLQPVPGYYDTQSSTPRMVNSGHPWADGKEAASQSTAASLRLDYDLSALQVVSISGYAHQLEYSIFDESMGPVPLVIAYLPFGNKQASQEFQFISRPDQTLTWLGGLYYLSSYTSMIPTRLEGLGVPQFTYIDSDGTVKTTSYAAFVEGTYHFDSKTRFIAGGRYTYDRKQLYGSTQFVQQPFAPAVVPFDNANNWKEPTWRLSLSRDILADSMVYISDNRGFKSGSVYGITFSGVPDPPLKPEILDAYELGMKGTFFDKTFSFTTDVFYYNYRDLQTSQVTGPGVVQLKNAANAKVTGWEFSSANAIGERLTVRTGVAYLNTRFRSFPNGPSTSPAPGGGLLQGEADLSGNQLQHAPKWTGNLAADYKMPTAVGDFVANATYYFNSGFYWFPDNRLRSAPYSIVNAELTWNLPGDRFSVTGWSKNLTGRRYAIFAVDSAFGDAYSAAPPRTYGLRFTMTLH